LSAPPLKGFFYYFTAVFCFFKGLAPVSECKKTTLAAVNQGGFFAMI